MKQSIFLFILILSFATQAARKEDTRDGERGAGGTKRGERRKRRTPQADVAPEFISVMIIGALVLINMTLGESKAMMWVTGQ